MRLAKYCGKEMQCRALDRRRYFRSRGIVVPEVDVWRVPFCTNMLREYADSILGTQNIYVSL